jgi:hypothetical protein
VTEPDLRSRARFVEHLGKRIFLIDASGLGPEQLERLSEVAAPQVRAQPPGSVLTITHLQDARLDRGIMDKMRAYADGNRPYVKLACVTGLDPLHKLIYSAIRVLTRRDFHLFDTVDQAKDFLARQP